MDVTSDEIRSSRFQGTRHVYDRREVDAFLHRAAATLELFERKLAVTGSHVQSLEKALDLANSRARSVRERDSRIAELEAALASAQHNYELELERTEANASQPTPADIPEGALAQDARRRAEEIIEAARLEAEEIRTTAVEYTEQASEEAIELTAAAEATAAKLLEDAKRHESAMLKELATSRAQAEISLEAEIEAKRIALEDELVADGDRLVGRNVVATAEMAERLERAEERAAKIASKSQRIIEQAEERARIAGEERDQLAEELRRSRLETESNRAQLLADVELMVGEAVTQAEIDRDLMLLDAHSRLEAAEGEREALLELARAEASSMTRTAQEELEALRRQAAQMRTALSDLHQRFSDVGSVTAEDFELATALVDLDLRDLSEIVDLTDDENPVEPEGSAPQRTDPLKSKWAQRAAVAPRGSIAVDLEAAEASLDAAQAENMQLENLPLENVPLGKMDAAEEADGTAASNGEHHPTWRDKVAPTHPAAPEPVEGSGESLGFYERRLAGLRARLQEAMPDDY